ncbi:MAG: homocysteine S-methyltransferase, partial [Boseongicola sp.]|nr:homocysteine S-methyltransferase [Boseongicola sp.]
LDPDAWLANCSAPEAVTTALDTLGTFGKPFGGYANGFQQITKEFLKDKPTVDALSARPEMTPERYADIAMSWVDRGATIVGGCCEIGPAHIRAIADRLTAAGHNIV